MGLAVHRDFLDSLPCQCCGRKAHGPMFFHSRCHPEEAVSLIQYKDGITTVSCAGCERLVVEIQTEEPGFDLPSSPVEVTYIKGKIHVVGHGRFRVLPDLTLN